MSVTCVYSRPPIEVPAALSGASSAMSPRVASHHSTGILLNDAQRREYKLF